jgi:hypothetical protein
LPDVGKSGNAMGKRSNFERREADFYPTPRAAVVPLIPHLRGIRGFAEPCAGDGALVRHLEGFGLRCVYAGDIQTGQDALVIDHYGAADAIITHPPHARDLMHSLIAHFQRISPTWLLLESDWTSTQQAAPFLRRCSDIVPIGRVKWNEGSKHADKDNYAWYRFDIRHRSGPIFHACEGEMSITAQRRAQRNAEEARRRADLAELRREERNSAARERRAAMKAAAERERELSKLIGALGMLGSEHAGERAAAALLAERLRLKLGKQWRDLIR